MSKEIIILDESKQLLNEGLLEEALKYIESSLNNSEFSIENKLELLLLLSKTNSLMGKYDENKAVVNQIVSLRKDKPELVYYYYRAKIISASVHFRSGSYKECTKNLKSLEKALMKETKINKSQIDELHLRIILMNGMVTAKSGDIELGVELYTKGLKIAKNVKNDDLVGRLNNLFGNNHSDSGNLDEALKYYTTALFHWEKSGNVISRSMALNNIGIVHSTKGDINQGLDFFLKALKLNEKTGNKENIANQLHNIGYLYYLKGELDTSNYYNQKALKLFLEVNNKMRIGLSYLSIGQYYQRKGELDIALEFLNKTKKIFNDYDNAFYIAQVYLSIGEVYFSKMDFRKAKQYTEISVKNSEKITNDVQASQGIYQLIKISLETNSMKEAKEYLTKLYDISEKEENKHVTMLHRLSKAFVLQSEENTSDEISFASLYTILGRFVTAKDIISEIINGEVIDYERIVEGIFNLCELLIMELKILGNESILDELDLLTNKLVEIGETQNAFSLLAKTYLLKGKLELLKPDLKAASRLFEKAQQISEEKGYKLLAKVIKEEHKNIDSSYDKLVDGKESTLLDRLGAIKLEGLLFSLKQNRVETYSANATTSAPSMKDLAGFAQSLQKRKVGW